MSTLPTTTNQDFVDTLNQITQTEKVTFEQRCILQRFPFPSLASQFNDLTENEIVTVRILEEKNLYRILDTAMLVYATDDNKQSYVVKQKILETPFAQSVMKAIDKKGFPQDEVRAKQASFLFRYILNNFNVNGKAPFVFEGRVPSKPFSFRQSLAASWFDKNATRIIDLSRIIYAYSNDSDEAKSFVVSTIAHHLNHSQPEVYSVSNPNDENHSVYEISVQLISRIHAGTSDHYDFSFLK